MHAEQRIFYTTMENRRNPYRSPTPLRNSASEQTDLHFDNKPIVMLVTIARTMAATLGAALGILLVSGLGNLAGPLGQVHRWTAHGLVILLWLCLPFAIVVLLVQKLRQLPFASIGQALALLFCLPVSLVTAFTGYLGPFQNPDLDEATRNRFNVLHMVVLPSILAALFVSWFFIFRPRRKTVSSPSR
jgi:hypothetical protein